MHLDAIRYTTEMASVAYERLLNVLMNEPHVEQGTSAQFRQTTIVMLDAWSIIDAAHRYNTFVQNFPGLRNTSIKSSVKKATEDAAFLRDKVQHQVTEIVGADSAPHLWGHVSWAEYRNEKHTGWWKMIAAGTHFKGDEFLFAGPATAPEGVPNGHIRLNAFAKQVYLGKLVSSMVLSTNKICDEVNSCKVKPASSLDVERSASDLRMQEIIEVIISVPSNAEAKN